MKYISLGLMLLFSSTLFAQVGVGTTTPETSAMLEVKSTTKGFLPPRVALTSTSVIGNVIASPTTGLLVYNTATAGVAPNNVVPGYYYYNGTDWTLLSTASNLSSSYLPLTGGKLSGLLKVLSPDSDTALFVQNTSPTSNPQIGILGSYNHFFYGAAIVGVGYNGTKPQTFNDIGVYGSSSDIGVWSNGSLKVTDGSQGAGKVLTSDADGKATWQVPTSTSVGSISSSSTANGATITSGVLNLSPADATNGGIITTGAQNLAGNKTLDGTLGLGTISTDASAKFEVNSTSQGFLPPRMTYLQRQSINTPATGLVIFCSDCGSQAIGGELQVYSGGMWRNLMGGAAATTIPTVASTTAASNITSTSATSGGNVTSDGGSTITARGVCWSTSQNPTTSSSKTTDGGAIGTFVSNLSGLTTNKTYYVRAYATNASGTSYGTQISFTTTSVAIGEVYGGGKVAYILQSGDRGYVAGQVHGLIAATVDLYGRWSDNSFYVNARDSVVGYGKDNTMKILNSTSNSSGCAASICVNSVEGGFSDWFLPSKDELNKLYINRTAIGLPTVAYYWSSTEIDYQKAWGLSVSNGNFLSSTKQGQGNVRPIRSF